MTNFPINNESELTGGLMVPTGSTLQRPGATSLLNGLLRYNSTIGQLEGMISGTYTAIAVSGAGGFLLASNNLTDVISPSAAITNLLPSQATNSGKLLTTNGTVASWGSASSSGTISSFNLTGGTTGLTTSGGPVTGIGTITLAGVLNVANGGTGATSWQTAWPNLGYSVNSPASSATNITLTNPMSPIQNIQFSAAAQNLILPPMNVATSIPIGWPVYIINPGSNAYNILAQDGTTTLYAGIQQNETVILILTSSSTANGTFQVIPVLSASNNLLELSNITTARTSLGLGTLALLPQTTFLAVASNLSDVASPPTALTNLGLGSIATSSTITNASWSGTQLSVTNGGTGQTTLTAHGILVGNTTSGITQLAAGGSGTFLVGAGASSDPTYTATPVLGVNTSVTGQLLLANGNASGVSVTIQNASATTAYNFNLPTTAGTTGQVLTSAAGTTNPMTWTTLAASATTATTSASNITGGTIGLGLLPSITGNTILGNSGGSTAVPAAITASAVLNMIGSTQGDILYASSSTAWSVLPPGASGLFLQTKGAGNAPAWGSGVVANVQTFTSSGTWTKPASGTMTWVQIWGGGGGGGGGNGSSSGSGGGGGGYNTIWFPTSSLTSTVTVTIGAGSAGAPPGNVAAAGGNSTFGSFITGWGGGGGGWITGNFVGGGGGGGTQGAGQSVGASLNGGVGGFPIGNLNGGWGGIPNTGGVGIGVGSNLVGGGGGGSGNSSNIYGADSFYGGGGGAAAIAGGQNGGHSVYGGGGGGTGNYTAGGGGPGGDSIYGGNGGTGTATGSTGNASAGQQPGGGGGGSNNGTGGSGAKGQCIVITFP